MAMDGILLAGLALTLLGSLVCLSGHLWLMIRAFQKSVLWGLLVLLLSPLANILFAIKYWALARKPFLLSVAGVALMALPLLGLVFFRLKESGMAFSVFRAQVEESAVVSGIEEDGIPLTDRERVADMLQVAGIDPENPSTFKGRSIAQMTKALGKPSAVMKQGSDHTFIFHGCFEVVSRDGGKTVASVHYMGK